MNWHLDTEVAERYAGGQVTPVLAASLEQHLIGCVECRALLLGEPTRLEAVWSNVREQVHAPRSSLVERALHQVGVSAPTARVIAATPALRAAWFTSVIVVLALALWAGHASPRGILLFTTLAPVLPLLGVAAAFGPGLDPTHEVAAASPYSMLRLLAVRTIFVVSTTLVPIGAAGLLLPGDAWPAVGWLLPSLALTTLSLAAARIVPLHLAALGLTGLWVGLCVLRAAAERTGSSVEDTASVQLISLLILTVAGWSVATHRQELSEQLRRHL